MIREGLEDFTGIATTPVKVLRTALGVVDVREAA